MTWAAAESRGLPNRFARRGFCTLTLSRSDAEYPTLMCTLLRSKVIDQLMGPDRLDTSVKERTARPLLPTARSAVVERGRGERKLFSFRVPGGGGCQGMAAGRSGIAEGCAEPVGGYVGVRAGVLFDGDGSRSMVNGEYQRAT